MMAFTIAWRELRNLFLSPLAWVLLFAVQLIHGWLFAVYVEGVLAAPPNGVTGVTDLVAGNLFGVASFLMLLVVPLLSMRLFSEERRNGSLTLLLSAPVRVSEIVLGKYLGLMGLLALMVALLTAMPLSLAAGTQLDYGKLAAEGLGLLLLLSAFAAAGLFMSTLTRQPVVAAIASFGLLMFLWVISSLGRGNLHLSSGLHYLSLLDHYFSLLRGTFDSADVIFYLLFSIVFLSLSMWRLDLARLQA